MKRYLCIFIFVFIGIATKAEIYETGTYYINTFQDIDVFIENGASVMPVSGTDIVVNDVTNLYNNGNVYGRIDANGYNVYVYNTGNLSGGITTENGGNVIQVIRSVSDVTNFSVYGNNHVVQINDVSGLNFDSIKNIDANLFTIKGSSVVVNNFTDWKNWNKNVRLEGPVFLIVENPDSVHSGDVIENIVYGWENLNIQINNIDDLYVLDLEQMGDDLFVNFERVTDYNLIHDDDSGDNSGELNNNSENVLEEIRDNNPDDKLIKALDAANTRNDIDNIKNHSYRFNRSILSRPIKIINNFSLSDRIDVNDGFSGGINAGYIFSDTTNDFSGRVYVGNKYNDLYMNFGFTFNSFSYKDSLNDFSGLAYGLDIRAKQNFGNFWLGGIGGVLLVNFDADYVSSDNQLKYDPFGMSGYGKIDTGYDFEIMSDFVLSPFVGVYHQRYKIADVSGNDSDMRIGTDIKYSFITDGIKYEYLLNTALTTNGDIFSSIKVGFWSVADSLGINLNAGVFKDDTEYSYKLFIDAKMTF